MTDMEEQNKLLHTIIEQKKAHIQAQEARLAEKDTIIADLRKLVDELRFLKANLEETLNEFRRQFFGIKSEKTVPKKTEQEQPKEKIHTGRAVCRPSRA